MQKDYTFENTPSAKDILFFFNNFWQLFLILMLFGLGCSITLINFLPNKYESVAYILVPQATKNQNNFEFFNIGSPELLITKLRSPYIYDSFDKEVCGFKDNEMVSMIKSSIIKSEDSIIELRVNQATSELAHSCMSMMVEKVHKYQYQQVEKNVDIAKAQMKIIEEKIQKNKYERITKLLSDHDEKFKYLYDYEEFKILSLQRENLMKFISKSESLQTQLIAPIAITDISPKKKNILASGLFAGLFLGLFLSLLGWQFKLNKIITSSGKK